MNGKAPTEVSRKCFVCSDLLDCPVLAVMAWKLWNGYFCIFVSQTKCQRDARLTWFILCLISSGNHRGCHTILYSSHMIVWCGFLTWGQFDLQGSADEGHQGGGEVDAVVLGDGHVHFDKALRRGDELWQRDFRWLSDSRQPQQNIQLTQKKQSVCCCPSIPAMDLLC